MIKQSLLVKFRYSEKAKQIGKISHFVLTLLKMRVGGGQNDPLVRRMSVISNMVMLWLQKILTFSINIPTRRYIVKSFFDYLDRFFRNYAETNKKLGFLGIENHKIVCFFNFFITKTSDFLSYVTKQSALPIVKISQ
jgi:hypothetical protein